LSQEQIRLRRAIDRLCRQRDAYASRLFWYTDFQKALDTAKQQKKPVVTLRLLGNLDEEISCANSRYFRTVLYSNSAVSKMLREHFILHWESVRPVPRITIDFGDGRTVERTITGNSIHYILDSQGGLVDAFPGLYGARTFLQGLSNARSFLRFADSRKEEERSALLAEYHERLRNSILGSWKRDLQRLGKKFAPQEVNLAAMRTPRTGFFPRSAVRAGAVAMSKSMVELPILRSMLPERADLSEATQDWDAIAKLHFREARLDPASLAFLKRKHLRDCVVGKEAELEKVLANFQKTVARDTVYNEYVFRCQILEWLAADNPEPDLKALNERVYADLFLTPSSDPWLGLVPPATYAALETSR
ncbi:MAG: hypothetical protein V3T77_06645, partial [Planctomycetota bacterium]